MDDETNNISKSLCRIVLIDRWLLGFCGYQGDLSDLYARCF
jgi:hypothetical protein